MLQHSGILLLLLHHLLVLCIALFRLSNERLRNLAALVQLMAALKLVCMKKPPCHRDRVSQ